MQNRNLMSKARITTMYCQAHSKKNEIYKAFHYSKFSCGGLFRNYIYLLLIQLNFIIIIINRKNQEVINGKAVNIAAAPSLVDGLTLVPLRFISEALGAEVLWDGKTKTININLGDDTAANPVLTNFNNCTELREVYPNGVAKGHPAYQAMMDRDKDGWACE